MINPASAAKSFSDLDQVLRVEELFLLQRVAQKINSILDLETLLDQIVGDVANTFGYNRLAVLLKDDETNELVIAAGWTGELCLKGTRFKIGQGVGMSAHAAASGETFYAPDVRKIPFYVVGEEDTRSEVDIPLKIHGELIGVFNVQHTTMNAFSPERIRLLEALAGHVATAIANARMFQRERLEKERMTKELEEARAIQTHLFPLKPPETGGLEITGVCLPCREVGGDWYDYIPMSDGRLAVVLADVSGKGMGAALLMSSTRSVLRMHAARGLSPSEVLSEVNSFLVEDFPASRFVTLIYSVVDPAKRKITFASAGHLPPVFVDSSGARFLESDAGLPLGIMECDFSEHEIDMPDGSRLFFYSDGVTEAINSSLDEYGAGRILKHVTNQTATVQSLLDDVNEFTSGYPKADDVTVVMIASAGTF
jgi:sigma-B regulation protein RsbU (phosphoserine phosphatase)